MLTFCNHNNQHTRNAHLFNYETACTLLDTVNHVINSTLEELDRTEEVPVKVVNKPTNEPNNFWKGFSLF
jgi:hypothetical protein